MLKSQRQLDLLKPWVKQWSTNVNTAECVTRLPASHGYLRHMTVVVESLRWSNMNKYLGPHWTDMTTSVIIAPLSQHRTPCTHLCYSCLHAAENSLVDHIKNWATRLRNNSPCDPTTINSSPNSKHKRISLLPTYAQLRTTS
ncbi:hypothetical protein J6590_062925 [Homalodisca vitripennis]|nr:hypothetical protein J6590_062925 [Homalodisca vitripennis]